MKRLRHAALALALGAIAASAAAAQDPRDPRCVDPTLAVVGPLGTGGDACQKAVDLFNYLTPQLGSVIAGGNPTLGQAGTLGGPGRFSILVRVTALRGDLPNADATGTSAGPALTPSTYGTTERAMPLPAVDAAVGLFPGIPLGITTVLGVDALGSAYYLPEYDDDEAIDIHTPDGSFDFGYGARIGIVGETAVLPGLSVTWMRRNLPSVSAVGRPTDIDEIALGDFENRTTSWRLIAGKRFGLLGLSAGYGRDRYESSARLTWHVQQGTLQESQGSFAFDGGKVDATNVFANALLNLAVFQLAAEVGRVTVDRGAGDFFNQFEDEPDAARLYASLGFRLGR
ncbi:MAG TPA: hypothetical protein VK922_04180 [Gemmatimonadaceae bacterium]|nr:hypothetical protein [Gemmatimonadaceae bacterium]